FMSDLLVAKYYHQVVLRDVHVSPDEAQKYLDQHKSQSAGKAGFYVREIRVDNQTLAEQLWREVTQEHHDFEAVVRQHSQAPNAEHGGLAYYAEGQLPDVLEKALAPLKPGDISPVIESSFGFHIFKLDRRTQPRTDDERHSSQLDEDRSRLIEDAIERKNQEAVDGAVSKLVSDASISISDSALGFTYSGKLRHN
ncbi:MAG TPA: peptidylprolyl isomerase, partial [Blastocatellia bacterium]|nr:peptidylprolyl isomerase [Blastocatellia bacterium]